MIYGVGTDILEIKRVYEAIERQSFLERIFTENERRQAEKHKARLAGDFVVKEAVAKAFGTGFIHMRPSEIEVLRDENGKPYVNLYGNADAFALEHHIQHIHVSISDTEELVTGFAVAEASN